jgi:hypothetical protein
MKLPALLLALLAVLAATPPVYADAKSDFQSLPATLDPTGCPNGDQSKQQELAELNKVKEMNKVNCGAGEDWSKCIMRLQGIQN